MDAKLGLLNLGRMYTHGVDAVRRRPGTVLTLYGANLVFTLAFTLAAAFFLASAFGAHPLFDRGVSGDLAALLSALREAPLVAPALFWTGVALALIYFVASQLLLGGLLERLRDDESLTRAAAARRFGAGATAHLGRFLRVWLWTWLLWIPALIATGIGFAAGLRGLTSALELGPVVGRLLIALVPALLLGALAGAVGDYARLLVVSDPELAPRRAVWRALRMVLRRPITLVHFGSYVAAWLLVSGLYVLATSGHPFAGAGGVLLLLAIRQLIALARIALRVAAFAGQQALL